MAIRRKVRESTGIYQRVSRTSDAKPGSAQHDADVQAIFQAMGEVLSPTKRLADVDALAKGILNKFRATVTEYHGGKKYVIKLPRNAPPIATDAAEVLHRLAFLRSWVEQGDALSAAAEGIVVGMAVERIMVREYEPITKRGRTAKKSDADAAESRRKKKSAERRKLVKRFHEVYKIEVDKKEAAYKRVADEFKGVKPSRVFRALKHES